MVKNKKKKIKKKKDLKDKKQFPGKHFFGPVDWAAVNKLKKLLKES